MNRRARAFIDTGPVSASTRDRLQYCRPDTIVFGGGLPTSPSYSPLPATIGSCVFQILGRRNWWRRAGAIRPVRGAARLWPVNDSLATLRTWLLDWLVVTAYPSGHVVASIRSNGGFVEALAADTTPLSIPAACRVQPRQIYAFAQASALGGKTTQHRSFVAGCDTWRTVIGGQMACIAP